MTVEEKALALVKKARQFCTSSMLVDVLCRDLAGELEHAIEREQAAIEAHEADKKAFSDVVKRMTETGKAYHAVLPVAQGAALDEYTKSIDTLRAFILPDPEPDPLVAALANVPDEDIRRIADSKDVAVCRSRIADALRGYKIERIEQ